MRNVNEILLDVIRVVREGNFSFVQLQERLEGVEERGIRALFMLAGMTENFEELHAAISRTGSATEAFEEMLETTAGKMQQLEARVDLMSRRIGEGFGDIVTVLGSIFLPAVEQAVGISTAMLGGLTLNTELALQGMLQVMLAHGVAAERAADMIAYYVEQGRISAEAGLRIAEALGVKSDRLMKLTELYKKGAEAVAEFGEEMKITSINIEAANELVAFNSLSRDHFKKRFRCSLVLKPFNSLSRDHAWCGEIHDDPPVRRFQLPLSGSQIEQAMSSEDVPIALSTPSLGITNMVLCLGV